MFGSSAFEVRGRTAVITGGSTGMGLCVARQLAEKGASVVIVARNEDKLIKGIAHVKEGAVSSQTQRFHYISADLTSSSEAIRVIEEVVSWNAGSPPDIVWCCAGSSYPSLFIDTPIAEFNNQMNSNYFSALYTSHAVLKRWLAPSSLAGPDAASTSASSETSNPKSDKPAAPRHLIFTASFLAFYSFTGYSPYSPSKAALRSLCDTLSQEMNLYAAANPFAPRVRVATIFPATIETESLVAENRIKPDVTKLLEEADGPQTPEVIAAKSIRALEAGREIVTTDLQTELVSKSMMGGSLRGGFFRGLGDWVLAGVLALVMVFVRYDFDNKVRKWGHEFGSSGTRQSKAPSKE